MLAGTKHGNVVVGIFRREYFHDWGEQHTIYKMSAGFLPLHLEAFKPMQVRVIIPKLLFLAHIFTIRRSVLYGCEVYFAPSSLRHFAASLTDDR